MTILINKEQFLRELLFLFSKRRKPLWLHLKMKNCWWATPTPIIFGCGCPAINYYLFNILYYLATIYCCTQKRTQQEESINVIFKYPVSLFLSAVCACFIFCCPEVFEKRRADVCQPVFLRLGRA